MSFNSRVSTNFFICSGFYLWFLLQQRKQDMKIIFKIDNSTVSSFWGLFKILFCQKLLNNYCVIYTPLRAWNTVQNLAVWHSCKTLPRFCTVACRVMLINTRHWLKSKSYILIRTLSALWLQEEGCSEARNSAHQAMGTRSVSPLLCSTGLWLLPKGNHPQSLLRESLLSGTCVASGNNFIQRHSEILTKAEE